MSLLRRDKQEAERDVSAADDLGAGTRAALDALEVAGARQARFKLDAERKRAQLGQVEARVGGEVLAAEDEGATATRLAGEIAQLRAAIDVDVHTAAAAVTKVEQARLALYAAEADDLEVERTEAKRALEIHVAKTRRLLSQLQEHEQWDYEQKSARNHDGTWRVGAGEPRGFALSTAVRRLSTRIVLLRLAAADIPLPRFARQQQIPGELYSPRLASALRGREAEMDVFSVPAGVVDQELLDDVVALMTWELG